MVKLGKGFKERAKQTAALRSRTARSRAERGVFMVQVEFPIALDERLERVAAANGLKKSDIVRDATISALDVLEASPAK